MRFRSFSLAASLIALPLLAGCAGALEGTSGKPDRLVVETADDPDAAYRNAAQGLLDLGYALSQSDETLRTVTTEYRQAEKGIGVMNAPQHVRVSIVVREATPTTVTYRATFKSSTFDDEESPVVKRGMGGSPAMNAWEELETAAASYPGGTVTTPAAP